MMSVILAMDDLSALSAARPLYEQAMAIAERSLGPNHPTTRIFRRNLETLLAEMGFVVETKYCLFTDDLRDKESAKIECGKAHFRALAAGEAPARFVQARTLDDVFAEM